jgi:hypothetical protein
MGKTLFGLSFDQGGPFKSLSGFESEPHFTLDHAYQTGTVSLRSCFRGILGRLRSAIVLEVAKLASKRAL